MRGCPLAVNWSDAIIFLRMEGIFNSMAGPGYEERRRNLVESLTRSGYIVSDRVREAFLNVPRELFVPDHLREKAYVDSPLPIGSGQTISAPSMIAIMLEEMDLVPEQRVLEIGTGSGYNAALLYEMVECKIFTIERIPELAEFARENLKSAGYEGNVEVVVGDGTQGHSPAGPYDRIVVTAGAPRIPKPLGEQLKQGGMIGIPVGGNRSFQEFITATKDEDGELKRTSHGGCAFVPLIGEEGW